ncbi:hypothetical protein [Amycolatopsis magusensis]|uniref:hypothetical protein n=1 Tax=Amycolatopsis magusensis TaxID=882444 RepID=UPI00379D49E7
MLHHRTLTPVVLRDWAIKIELFTGALVLTTNTSTASHREQGIQPPRGVRAAAQLTVTHWCRPHPRPSPYLALATEPVPWPDRDDDYRPPTGGRRRVDSEKRLAATTSVPISPLRSSLGALVDD